MIYIFFFLETFTVISFSLSFWNFAMLNPGMELFFILCAEFSVSPFQSEGLFFFTLRMFSSTISKYFDAIHFSSRTLVVGLIISFSYIFPSLSSDCNFWKISLTDDTSFWMLRKFSTPFVFLWAISFYWHFWHSMLILIYEYNILPIRIYSI